VCAPRWTGVDAFPHPGQGLLLAPRRQAATGGLQIAKAPHGVPEGVHALPQQGADLDHLRVPDRIVVVRMVRVAVQAQQAQRRGDLRLCPHGGVGVDVGLVDDHQVGHLHDALLDGLQIVAGVGQLQQHEHVGHARHRRLALTDTHGLDDHDVVACGLADQHGLARLLGHAAQRAT
jgi:hypothetical protein